MKITAWLCLPALRIVCLRISFEPSLGGKGFLWFQLGKCTQNNPNKNEMNNQSTIFSVIVTRINQVSLYKQKIQVLLQLWPLISFPIRSLCPLFSVWRLHVCHVWQTVMLPCSLTPAAGPVEPSPCPSLVFCLFVSSVSATLTVSICFFLTLS